MLEKDLSVDKIIKNLRDLKIAVKSKLLDSDESKYLIQHHQRNIIDLEEDSNLEPMHVDSVTRELKEIFEDYNSTANLEVPKLKPSK